MLEGGEPIHLDCAGEVTHSVKQGIFIGFDETDSGVIQILGDPGGLDEIFRVSVWHDFSPNKLYFYYKNIINTSQGGISRIPACFHPFEAPWEFPAFWSECAYAHSDQNAGFFTTIPGKLRFNLKLTQMGNLEQGCPG
jgi:hypothetical protein